MRSSNPPILRKDSRCTQTIEVPPIRLRINIAWKVMCSAGVEM